MSSQVESLSLSSSYENNPYQLSSVSCLVSPALTSSECDLFEESTLCISHLFNLIDRQPAKDEAACQNLCQQSHAECKNFTFVENKYPLKSGEPNLQCYLWKRCIKQVRSCTFFVSILGRGGGAGNNFFLPFLWIIYNYCGTRCPAL